MMQLDWMQKKRFVNQHYKDKQLNEDDRIAAHDIFCKII